jgi:D-alanine-D-alanine ligase
MAEVPYVGAGVTSSAVGMDKELTKIICEADNIAVVEWVTLHWGRHRDDPVEVRRALKAASITPPLFVKPVALGSSVGISRVDHEESLDSAIELAFRFHRRILVERAIEGRELECAVIGNTTGNGVSHRPEVAEHLAEIRPREGWYDYERKYTQGATDILIPADVDESLAANLRALALQVYEAMEVDGMARVDFLVETGTASPKVYLNELNTIPGFTATSVYSKLWEATGLAYPDLIYQLLELGIARRFFLDQFGSARMANGA